MLFAGLDPGTTVGYCVLDIEGKIVEFNSSKHLPISILIRKLSDLGRIIVIGTDRAKIPYMVKTVATKFGALISNPKEDVSVSEKISLTKSIDTKNSHERDALASALIAYSSYSKRIKDVVAFLESNEIDNEKNIRDLFIETALKKPNISYNTILETINNSYADFDSGKDNFNHEEKISESDNHDPRLEEISNLKSVLRQTTKHNHILQNENILLRNQIQKLSATLEKIQNKFQSAPMTKSEKELMEIISFKERRLQSYISKLYNIEKEKSQMKSKIARLVSLFSRKDVIVLDSIPTFSKLEYLQSILDFSKNKIIFVDDINVYTDKSISIAEKNELIIISQQKINTNLKVNLRKKVGATVIEWDKQFERVENKVVIQQSDFETKLQQSDNFDNIVSEYQEMRKKELLR